MDEKQLKSLTQDLEKTIDGVMEAKMRDIVGPEAAATARKVVEDMRVERAVFGEDRTGLKEAQKKDFVSAVHAIVNRDFSNIDIKANEALIEEQDNRGGYLVAREVANAIMRIAASVGLVMSQAMKWPMTTDQLGVPRYTGSFLEGEYLGVDAAGSVTAMTFGSAELVIKKWQLAFVVGNDLLADATVELADWLLALGGEALANKIDQQAFEGAGDPFVGLLNSSDVTITTLASSNDAFTDYNVIDDSSDLIAGVEESVLDGAAFYMHRTVWANLRVQKDDNNGYILPMAGAASNNVLKNNPTGGGVRPAGEILGFPVFTTRHLPSLSDSAASTKFLVFGNMKAMAYGDKGELRVAQHDSGSFGGKEIALSDQKGMVYKHRHALTIALGAAFNVAKTAAS